MRFLWTPAVQRQSHAIDDGFSLPFARIEPSIERRLTLPPFSPSPPPKEERESVAVSSCASLHSIFAVDIVVPAWLSLTCKLASEELSIYETNNYGNKAKKQNDKMFVRTGNGQWHLHWRCRWNSDGGRHARHSRGYRHWGRRGLRPRCRFGGQEVQTRMKSHS